MKTKYQILIICLLASTWVSAQQLPLFNAYRDHWNVLNPASISNNYLINELNYSVGASYRQQWFNLKESPNLQLINVEIIPEEYDNIVTGGFIMRDQVGLISNTGIYGQFAYQIPFGLRTKQALVIGLHAGFVQYRAELDQINFEQPESNAIQNENTYFPDFGFGAFYYYKDLFYAGVSVPQLFGLTTTYQAEEEEFSIQRIQHFYAVAGGYFNVTWFGLEASFIEPSVWLRYAPRSPISVDLSARYQLSDFFWLGLGTGWGLGETLTSTLRFETGMVLGETVGFTNGQLKIGVGFDLPLNSYRSFFGTSFEINVIYSWY